MSGKVTVRNLKVFGLAAKSCSMAFTKSSHTLISLVLTRDFRSCQVEDMHYQKRSPDTMDYSEWDY
jgi:hypothetical protein